ncbi:29300_t:CDS:1, partial [Gigaspora margarita]
YASLIYKTTIQLEIIQVLLWQQDYASLICETYDSIGAILPRQRNYESFI